MRVYTAVPLGGDPLEDGEVIVARNAAEAFEEAVHRNPDPRGWIIKFVKMILTGKLEV